MSPLEIVAVLALVGFAVYKQSQRQLVTGSSRFKLAITYAVVGLAVGGFAWPEGIWAWVMLAVGLALSAAVGFARGRLTPMWTEDGPDGPRVVSQGTALTIGLFLGLGRSSSPGHLRLLHRDRRWRRIRRGALHDRDHGGAPGPDHVAARPGPAPGARPGSPARLRPTLTSRRSWPARPSPRAGHRLCGAGGAARRAVSATRVADAKAQTVVQPAVRH